ncbi:DgyrCDS6573 [Dimorphilus gyrociliatus]|uniref:DgyrCDS6573 n=1 Tax=Dimorphilus gyrociliatus TaxID=2664684 RepID=A0A7I8VQR2_9ANNE|nr:DgyrCDS6573 [Dimorphilus gyrociliatus]
MTDRRLTTVICPLFVFLISSAPIREQQDEALNYLQKYGYLTQSNHLDIKSETFKNALKSYQRRYHIHSKDGIIDDETLKKIREKRCGDSDEDMETEDEVKDLVSRSKRSSMGNGSIKPGQKVFYNRKIIKWRYVTKSKYISEYIVRFAINNALRLWAEVTPLTFREDTRSDIRNIDIEISFGKGKHGACPIRFDGHGQAIAHSWHGAAVHLDDDEMYSYPARRDSLDLVKVLLHEFGHVLGLRHTAHSDSIMYAIYLNPFEGYVELHKLDRQAVQNIHGVCKGRFDEVFDWIRPLLSGSIVYNTFFTRNTVTWLYENSAYRTRYGDPLKISKQWRGLPQDFKIDAYIQTYPGYLKSKVYFISGYKVYRYDSLGMKIENGYPKLISQVFQGITNDKIDAGYFDPRDRNIYLIRGSKVFKLKPNSSGASLISTNSFESQFPIDRSHFETRKRPLTAPIDSIYYSQYHSSIFIFKDESVYKIASFNYRSVFVYNLIRIYDNWYNKWNDICEV